MKKLSVLSVAVLITMSIFMQGCYFLPIPLIADPSEMFGCSHEWQDATCTDPRICALCGETAGSPNGHNWSEGTCTTPPTCEMCGETRGEAPGHKMTVTSNYCEICGEFEYYELRAVKGVVDIFTSYFNEYQRQGYIEGFEILDICYVVTDNCQCVCCDQYEYDGVEKGVVGTPYLTAFILYGADITASGESIGLGESGVHLDIVGVHTLQEERNTYYNPAEYDLGYRFHWSEYELDIVYAQDNSFYYRAKDLIHVNMREILSN